MPPAGAPAGVVPQEGLALCQSSSVALFAGSLRLGGCAGPGAASWLHELRWYAEEMQGLVRAAGNHAVASLVLLDALWGPAHMLTGSIACAGNLIYGHYASCSTNRFADGL